MPAIRMLTRRLSLAALLLFLAAAAAFAAEGQTLPGREAFLNAPWLHGDSVPVQTSVGTVEGPAFVPKPDGSGYVMLFVYYNYSTLDEDKDFVAVDTLTGNVTRFLVPGWMEVHLQLSENFIVAPDGKAYVLFGNRQRGGQVWCYDPAKNTFGAVAASPSELGSSTDISMTAGGLIVGSTTTWFNHALAGGEGDRIGVWSYDPKSGAVRSHGFAGPAFTHGGETRAYATTAVGDWFYLACGKIPWSLVAFNSKTGESKVILEAPAGGRSIWVWDEWAYRHPDANDDKKIEYFQLKDGEAVPIQRPTHGAPAPKIPRPQVWTGNLEPTADGRSILWYKLPERDVWNGVALHVRTYPQVVKRLTTMPDGRLFGTGAAYKGNFIFDPKTGESEWLGLIVLSHYATTIHDGKTYISGYAGSPIWEYDPARPWTANKAEFGKKSVPLTAPGSNPRLVTWLGESGSHKMWGAGAGADGRIYFSGEMIRSGDGGAFGWWDPKAEKKGWLPWQTFAGYKTLNLTPVRGGKWIALGSYCVRNNITNETPDTAKLFIFDVAAGKIVKEYEPIKGARKIGPMIETAPGRIVSISGNPADKDGGLIFGMNLETGEVTFTVKLPAAVVGFPSGGVGTSEFVRAPDGSIWTYVAENSGARFVTLVRFEPTTREVRIIGRVLGRGPLAFSGRDLYRGPVFEPGRLIRYKDVVASEQ